MTRPTTRKTTHPTARLGFQGRDRGTSDSLTQYLHEITRYPVLSRDEEADVGFTGLLEPGRHPRGGESGGGEEVQRRHGAARVGARGRTQHRDVERSRRRAARRSRAGRAGARQ